MDLAEIEVRLGVQDLLARYTHAGDEHEAELFGSHFGAEGVLEVVGGERGAGTAAVSQLMRNFLALLQSTPGFLPFHHHLVSTKIEVLGHDEARATSYFSVSTSNRIDHWGVYRDQVHRVDSRWEFAQRLVTIAGCVEGSPCAPLIPDR